MRRETPLPPGILDAIRRALAEDIGSGDATTNSIVPADADMHGQIIAKQAGIVAGLDVAQAVYWMVDGKVSCSPKADEGARVTNRQVLALVSGRARSLLTAERTALNFLGRISGIATLTGQFVEAVSAPPTPGSKWKSRHGLWKTCRKPFQPGWNASCWIICRWQ